MRSYVFHPAALLEAEHATELLGKTRLILHSRDGALRQSDIVHRCEQALNFIARQKKNARVNSV